MDRHYFSLKKISTISSKTKLLATSITAIIIWLSSYNHNIKPLQNKLQHTLAQQTIAKLQIHATQQKIQQLTLRQKQWGNLAKNTLPQKNQNAAEQLTTNSILKNISTIIASSQLTIITLKPESTTNKQQSLNLTSVGNYQQILDFFLAIKNINTLIDIPCFTIKNLGEDKLIFSATLQPRAFAHKKYQEKIVINRDPFQYSNAISSLPLTIWENKHLQFIGVLEQDAKTWGIINDPRGQLHYILKGDYIGTNKSKITEITSTAIMTEDNQNNLYRQINI